jgi:two-component system sensor histidine kinase PilS (NtrC family)
VDAPRVQRHVTVRMAARLALAVAGLGIALGLEAVGGGATISEWNGFYGVVAVVFVATLIYWPFAGRVQRMRPFALANLGLDLGLVTALVVFSGGSESVFTFLYMVVPVYAAVLLSGRGAVSCAGAAGVAYAAVLVAEHSGWLGLSVTVPDAVLAMRWVVHTGALLVVATLAGFMVGELERADEALHQRTSDLAALRTLHERTVESLMSGLLTTDREGRITSFNREAERITGLARERASGVAVTEVLPGIECVSLADSSETPVRLRIPYDGADGRRLYLGVGAHVLRDGRGETAGRVIIFQDVSEVVEMESQLRRSERLAAVGQLSASIAHEIRNPLAAISGAIQMLEAGNERGQDPVRLMNIVLREVDRLNHLITDFLEYARPSPVEWEQTDLAPIIEEVAGIVSMSHEGRIGVDVTVEPGLEATVDPRKLRQVVWNLLLNASEALPEGGRLSVEARTRRTSPAQGADSADRMGAEEKSAWAEIAVMDDGAGIEPELAERIFDPFFTTKAGGSGLGLPTVHRIVEEHGGSMRLERGQGDWSTVFRVLLPKHGVGR